MMKRPIFSSEGNLVVDQHGRQIFTHSNFKGVYSSAFESFVSGTKARVEDYYLIYTLERMLQLSEKYSSMLRLWPMYRTKVVSSMLREYITGATLTPTGGEVTYGVGIKGNGSSSYFTMDFNFSTSITDIDNFSFGIVSFTDDDTGVEIGASDGTNEVSISCKDGGNAVFNLGTVSVSAGITDGIGHYILNAYRGDARGFKGTHNSWNQIGSSTPITGVLPNRAAFLSALNNDATPTNYSEKEIILVWVYDGSLSEVGLRQIHQSILPFLTPKNI